MLDCDHLHTAVSALRKKQIFFVGGTVRSGTTWLQLLLHAHPSVSCSGEGHFPDRLWPFLKQTMEQHNGIIKKHNELVFKRDATIVGGAGKKSEIETRIYSSLEREDV